MSTFLEKSPNLHKVRRAKVRLGKARHDKARSDKTRHGLDRCIASAVHCERVALQDRRIMSAAHYERQGVAVRQNGGVFVDSRPFFLF